MPLTSGEVPRYEAERTFLQTHPPKYRTLFRFFAKKTEPKNASTVFRYAETGECLRTPWTFPLLPSCGSRGCICPPPMSKKNARQSATFLPLRRLDEMRMAVVFRILLACARLDIAQIPSPNDVGDGYSISRNEMRPPANVRHAPSIRLQTNDITFSLDASLVFMI